MFRSPSKKGEKLDLAARAAWLYYVGGKTQDEVAEKLGISRTSAQRLVARAFEGGIVKVRVYHEIGECLEAAQTLSRRFNLTVCEVVPSDCDDYDYALREIAVAGAQLMESYLESRKPRLIGVSIGRTVKAVISELKLGPVALCNGMASSTEKRSTS
jgi:DNA-binding transcriptional regulator LsrR (DeoR family)